ncbi:MAG: hypothetical protein NWR72_04985 [Bacteroidia bacterium]|nr:hypothetical protein [Bacteroidia bacterium]
MLQTGTFVIHIEGQRSGKPLGMDSLDVKDWIDSLQYGTDLLFPEGGKNRPQVSPQVEEGSIKFLFVTAIAAVIQVHALLSKINQTKELGILPQKQIKAIRYFANLARKESLQITLGDTTSLHQGLFLDKNTEFQPDNSAWIQVEPIVWGKVINIGGKTNPNIHLETKEFGTLIIQSSEEELADQKKNRLYHPQQLQIQISQHAHTGEYDSSSARLIKFIDYDEAESNDQYLDRLIEAGSSAWADVQDPDLWLLQQRGCKN